MESRTTRLILAFIAVLLSCQMASAQIAGIIRSSKNEKPLKDVLVFINKTDLKATTDENGVFEIQGIPEGFTEIVLYKEDYLLYRSTMKVTNGKSYKLTLNLTPGKPDRLKEPSKDELEDFRSRLFGEDEIKIPLQLKEAEGLHLRKEGKRFLINSGLPVVLEHPAAAYRISLFTPTRDFIDADMAAILYEDMLGVQLSQNVEVEMNRRQIYEGSLRHFLAGLAAGNAEAEGFIIKEHPPEGGWLVPSPQAGFFRLPKDRKLTVEYNGKTSTVETTGPVDFNAKGITITSNPLSLTGEMSHRELRFQLPTTFEPIKGEIDQVVQEAVRRAYEKAYVHTDKPYYYPGEPLWFKCYMNYYYPVWRDSLSKVLHVEWISPDRQIIDHRELRIEEGMTHGDFVLKDSLKSGTYFLRAYTVLQQNFKQQTIFVKPIPVLNKQDKPDPSKLSEHKSTFNGITVKTELPKHKTRDKISLQLTLDKEISIGGTVSVSVTDAGQVFSVPEATTILTAFPIKKDEMGRVSEIEFMPERSVSLYGQFLNDRDKPEKTSLTFMYPKTGEMYATNTDEHGYFWQSGLNFNDSAIFTFKTPKAKYRAYGKIKWLNRKPATLDFADPGYHFDVINASSVQRIISEYEVPKDNILLDAVEVRATTMEERAVMKKRTYGRADYVIDKSKFNTAYSNLLYALVGKVPGLVVNPSTNTIFFSRAAGGSLTGSTAPLLMINDQPIGGNPGDVLASIDPNIVESIEFTRRMNVLYGSAGASGVISVYIKEGASIDSDPNFKQVRVCGFNSPHPFRSPDYSDNNPDNSNTDFRSTIYWKNTLKVLPGHNAYVEFYASDLPGLYRVVVEGVTEKLEPIRAVYYFTVDQR